MPGLRHRGQPCTLRLVVPQTVLKRAAERLVVPQSSLVGRSGFWICIGLAGTYAFLFMVLPYFRVFQFSFWQASGYVVTPEFTFANYLKAFNNPLYVAVLWTSLKVAATVTLISVLVGYTLAMYLAFVASRHRYLLLLLVNLPIWTSFLLRAFIWKIILGRNGIVNGVLMDAGLITEPLSIFLYNWFSVSLSLVYIFLPFITLPIFAALERIPKGYIEASMDLGASPSMTFFRVVLPLSIPGVVAGATFVFCLSFGDFVTPTLLGGSDGVMIANLIINQFGAAFDWPFGSALAVVVLAVALGVLLLGGWAESGRGKNIV
jgi:spermidine/putrescine transport system permease protein